MLYFFPPLEKRQTPLSLILSINPLFMQLGEAISDDNMILE